MGIFGRMAKESGTVALSRKDRAILIELQRDSRLTMQQLAERVGMSSSACWRRVRALEQAGVIDRYAAIVNPRKAGFTLSSMTLVSLARHEQHNVENFVREVRRHPEVLECFATSGEADYHLRVVVEDMDAYNRFLDEFILKLPGVSQVRSNIILKEVKADTALPFRA
jgi:Lrp/AsnC family leucine-responsive transcriptional regulator